MKKTGIIRPLRCPARKANQPCYREITAKLLFTSRDRRLPPESRSNLRALGKEMRKNGFPGPCDNCTRVRLWAQKPKAG